MGGDILSRHHRLLVDVSSFVEDVHYSIAGVHARQFQHIADHLGRLEAAEKRRGYDGLDVLVYAKRDS